MADSRAADHRPIPIRGSTEIDPFETLTHEPAGRKARALRISANLRGAPLRKLQLSVWTTVIILVLSFALAVVVAVSFRVTSANQESGGGAYVAEAAQTYWVWTGTEDRLVPSPAPATVSTTVSAPTVLPSAPTAWAINTPTVGHTAIRWIFQEKVTAPVNTEIENAFTIALTGASITIKTYVETQSTAPGTALLFSFFYDPGGFAPNFNPPRFVIESVQVTASQCASIGSCP